MGSRLILLLVSFCMLVSVSLFSYKVDKQRHEIEQIEAGLSGFDKIVSSNTVVSFKGEPSKIELYLWARYMLAPRYIAYNEERDTSISILYLNSGDSALSASLADRTILYEKRDSRYRYLITAKVVKP